MLLRVFCSCSLQTPLTATCWLWATKMASSDYWTRESAPPTPSLCERVRVCWRTYVGVRACMQRSEYMISGVILSRNLSTQVSRIRPGMDTGHQSSGEHSTVCLDCNGCCVNLVCSRLLGDRLWGFKCSYLGPSKWQPDGSDEIPCCKH